MGPPLIHSPITEVIRNAYPLDLSSGRPTRCRSDSWGSHFFFACSAAFFMYPSAIAFPSASLFGGTFSTSPVDGALPPHPVTPRKSEPITPRHRTLRRDSIRILHEKKVKLAHEKRFETLSVRQTRPGAHVSADRTNSREISPWKRGPERAQSPEQVNDMRCDASNNHSARSYFCD